MRPLSLVLVVLSALACLDFAGAEEACIRAGKCLDGDAGVGGGAAVGGGTAGGASGGAAVGGGAAGGASGGAAGGGAAGGASGGTAGGVGGGTAGGASGGTAGGASGGAAGCNPGFSGTSVDVTVDLSVFGGVQGVSVESTPAGLNCPAVCRANLPRGAFTLSLKGPDAGVQQSAWTGACADAGFGSTCQVCPSAAQVTARLRVWPDDNLVFTAPTNMELGALGGVDGGDARCEAAAREVGLPGHYRAWLGPAGEAAARLGVARGWRRLDGVPFADLPEHLADGGALWSTLMLGSNSNGALTVATGPVATGALPDGGRADCAGWTNTSQLSEAGTGSPGFVGRAWQATASNLLTCNAFASIYCFGVDSTHPLAPAPVPSGARVAFLSTPWAVGGGPTAANAHCQREAADAGLPGTFTALLGTTAQSLLQGLTLDGGWYRLDGVAFAPRSGETTNPDDFPVAPLNLTLRGGFVTGEPTPVLDGVFTGAPNGPIGDLPTSNTCGDWMLTSGNGRIGNPSASSPSWWRAGTSGCSSPARLYCLQR